MSTTCVTTVIIIGAGIAGIAAGKVLSENGIHDFVILEASNRIGGRLVKKEFAGVMVEAGAGWIQGVGGRDMNPIWDLAHRHSLRTCFSDYSNARFNIYDPTYSDKKVPRSVAAAAYDVAVDSANRELAIEATSMVLKMGRSAERETKTGGFFSAGALQSMNECRGGRSGDACPPSPVELALDYMLHDFEMSEVEPIATYRDYGPKEFMVADERGYEYLVHKIAQEYLYYASEQTEVEAAPQGKNPIPIDTRLKLAKVVRKIEYTNDMVRMETEDGLVCIGKYAIVTASLGVLRSDLIKFSPELPRWKRESFSRCEYRVYTKIFLKFSKRFWPTGDGTEFFLYADKRRGYFTFWQHLENAYPGSNMLVVTVTDDESKRIEAQDDETTRREAMAVLRSIFGQDIPEADHILVPRWFSDRFQRGSYTNYPILPDPNHFRDIQAPVGAVFFSGEHTSEKFNGYVHGGYHSGIDTAKRVIHQMRNTEKLCVSCCNSALSCSCHLLHRPSDEGRLMLLTQAFAG